MHEPSHDTLELDDVLTLFAAYQRRLYLYIRSMLPAAADADEVLQETNIVVWRKFEQFQRGTDFRAWVFQIAYYEVRKFLDRSRRRGLAMSNELLDQLTAEYDRGESLLDDRRTRLADCLRKLSDRDRQLVERIYGQEISVARLAGETEREPTSIYRSLRRIRQQLLDCIEPRAPLQGGLPQGDAG